MGNRIDNKIILGSLRYKSATNVDSFLSIPLDQTTKEMVEFDRNVSIDLSQVFDDERQASTIFRPTAKFSILFKNSYVGTTKYLPLRNNLYYVNEKESTYLACQSVNPISILWSGYPQYNEFDFIRNDYNVTGYTRPPDNHLNFQSQSASSYNWNFFMTYAYDNVYDKELDAIEPRTKESLLWTCSDGIPFVIRKGVKNGFIVVKFVCPVKHGLIPSEYVKLSFSYNNNDTFQVYGLGDNSENSDEYIFTILDSGFTGTTFLNGVKGTFKRVINIFNSGDTISEYYIRRNKILTDSNDYVLGKSGFEQNIFGKTKKYESSGYTPNKVSRVSIKEGSQCYTLSFNTDIDISPLRDNQKRPVSELFFTVMWKGYFGLMFGKLASPGGSYYGLRQGYEFNLYLNNTTNLPTDHWSNLNNKSNTNFPVGVYSTTMGSGLGPNNGTIPFTYIESLNKGDILDGDYCEWNNYEQKERVISNIYHKFSYNPYVFNIGETAMGNNSLGYYYRPHFPVVIRKFSEYIEISDGLKMEGVPDYSYYSNNLKSYIWRDLYSYGYIDPDGVGVNYPFLNGVHYPYQDINFRIIPEGTNYIETSIIPEPLKDDCE